MTYIKSQYSPLYKNAMQITKYGQFKLLVSSLRDSQFLGGIIPVQKFELYEIMKILLVIFTLCVANALGGLSDKQKAQLISYKSTCRAETGVDEILLENLKNTETVPNDEKVMCYGACLLRHIGIMDEHGVINADVAHSLLPTDIPQKKRDEIIDRCKGLVEKDACHTGGLFYICFVKHKDFDLD